MESIVFIVSSPGNTAIENVILTAPTREVAKRDAMHLLRGNPEHYIVDPITKHGSRTVFLLAAR